MQELGEQGLYSVLNYHCNNWLCTLFLLRTDCQQNACLPTPPPPQPLPTLMFATLADLSSYPATQLLLKSGELQLQPPLLVLLSPLPVPSQFVSNLSMRWAVAIFFGFFHHQLPSFSFSSKPSAPTNHFDQLMISIKIDCCPSASQTSNHPPFAAVAVVCDGPLACALSCLSESPTFSLSLSLSFGLCLCNPATHRF